jgi:DNA-binding transcriptional MerR regulator
MPDVSLREALEKAYDDTERTPAGSSEAGGSTENSAEPVRTTAPTEKSEPTTTVADASDDTGTRTTEDPGAKPDATEGDDESARAVEVKDKAPESWKPAAREFWQKLPAEARQEIQRREADMNQFVQRTAAQRKIADAFINTVNPYMGMIQAEGGNPIETVNNLLATAAFLRTGPAAQKAVMVAKLVKDFGISIQDLDAALAGQDLPPDPNAQLQQLLDQRLAPVNQLLSTVQQARAQREQQTDAVVDQEIIAFAQDPKHEFFADVKDEMADMVELAARRGRTMSLAQAYERAVANDPEIQATLKRRAEQKKAAGSSLQSRGPSMGAPDAKGRSLRADLEFAFDTVANQR